MTFGTEKDRIDLSRCADAEQLKRYADDFRRLYESEKRKRDELGAAHGQLKIYADELNQTVGDLKAAHAEIQDAYYDTIHRLVLAAEFRDDDTGDHILRMSRYSALIAEKMGMSPQEVSDIEYAAPMHDIGKIGIPDGILLKPGQLTAEEFQIMKSHATIGARLLANSKAAILRLAQKIAVSHHERWNGTGYPQGHSGAKIPLVGRIVGAADVFDALTSRRPYKDPYPVEAACDIMRKERGKVFDPDIVDVFLKNIDGVVEIKQQVDGEEFSDVETFSLSGRDLAGHGV